MDSVHLTSELIFHKLQNLIMAKIDQPDYNLSQLFNHSRDVSVHFTIERNKT